MPFVWLFEKGLCCLMLYVHEPGHACMQIYIYLYSQYKLIANLKLSMYGFLILIY